ncbi:PREDICTED: uncharacterized protein KIAA0226-like homolog isoform X1 [Crocodylus porosus]|uniref:uncharacterized protein KIAA0226-like homolog isoform X1 n=2 Tax=Crocodylus porosus TaxID=8502 RepID=UPI000939E378|nr:PREDICTED: uncharacterized protein KIAA0226-like homolog isoform X1 [Crocodylus porosus]
MRAFTWERGDLGLGSVLGSVYVYLQLIKKIHKVAVTESTLSSDPAKIAPLRTSCLAQTPQISVLPDEYSRPAVIGHAGNFGSYPDSTAAIKDILVSVLNASGSKPSSLPEETVLQRAEHPGSDMECCEESSDGDYNDDSDVDYMRCKIACTQTDIRFTRHQAFWDNTECSSSKSSLESSSCSSTGRSPITSSQNNLTHLEQSPPKYDCFTQVTLTGGIVTSLMNSVASCSEKEHTNYSSPVEQPLTLITICPDSTANKLLEPTVSYEPLEPRPLRDETSKTFHNFSQLEPSEQQVSTDTTSSLNTRTTSLNCPLRDIFMLPADVEKENAHFFVADMIIASLEKTKCIIFTHQTEYWGADETDGSVGSYPVDLEMQSCTRVQQSDSCSSDSGYEGGGVLQVNSSVNPALDSDDEFVIIELEDLENISSVPDDRYLIFRSSLELGCCSAEVTAQKLYRSFRKRWLQMEPEVQLSRCLDTTGQKFVNRKDIPRELESSMNLAEEIKIKSRLRGTTDWAPPRSQIIFNIHPSEKREAVVAAQNFTCVGCGTPIECKYIRRLRYCDYLGKYFCDCCHTYTQSSIPARILMKWDFKKYYVCNFSKCLLDSIWQNPFFNVACINTTLYTKAKELNRVREIQEQLLLMKRLLKTCRLAERVLKEYEQVPCHLTEELHLFSMDDLVKVKRGQLLPLLRDILKSSTSHIENCELCQAKGFICEFCQRSDLLFPFQTAICKRCTACKACFHKECFQSEKCPKCLRIAARRRLSETSSPVPF